MRTVHQGSPQQRKHILQPKSFSQSDQSSRVAPIAHLIAGKSVLDLGAGTGHWRPDWMHGLIADLAAETVAVEIDEATVEAVRAKGFDVIHGDAEDLDLGRTFDVVFAGELIEHLSSFAGFLASAERHLGSDGVLVLTTPNAFAISNFVYRVLPGPVRVNTDHTCWFCEDTIRQLLDRHGFDAEVTYVRHRTPGRLRRILAGIARAPLADVVAWNTLLVIARPRSQERYDST